jgi:hypothetical protein
MKESVSVQAKQLAERLRKESLWYWDRHFPNDESEIYYYHEKEKELTTTTAVTEAMEAKGTVEVKGEENLKALLGTEGALQAGLLPSMQCDGAGGESALMKELGEVAGEGKVTKKKDKKTEKNGKPPPPVKPTEPIETAKALWVSMLLLAVCACQPQLVKTPSLRFS